MCRTVYAMHRAESLGRTHGKQHQHQGHKHKARTPSTHKHRGCVALQSTYVQSAMRGRGSNAPRGGRLRTARIHQAQHAVKEEGVVLQLCTTNTQAARSHGQGTSSGHSGQAQPKEVPLVLYPARSTRPSPTPLVLRKGRRGQLRGLGGGKGGGVKKLTKGPAPPPSR